MQRDNKARRVADKARQHRAVEMIVAHFQGFRRRKRFFHERDSVLAIQYAMRKWKMRQLFDTAMSMSGESRVHQAALYLITNFLANSLRFGTDVLPQRVEIRNRMASPTDGNP